MQIYAGFTSIISNYVIAIPAGCYFAYYLDYGLPGLWIGLNLNAFTQASVFTFIVYKANWDKITMKA